MLKLRLVGEKKLFRSFHYVEGSTAVACPRSMALRKNEIARCYKWLVKQSSNSISGRAAGSFVPILCPLCRLLSTTFYAELESRQETSSVKKSKKCHDFAMTTLFKAAISLACRWRERRGYDERKRHLNRT